MADVNLPASHLAMTDDERRLLSLFRSIPTTTGRSGLLSELCMSLLEHYHPGKTIYDFMPDDAGIEPGGSIHDPYSMAYIVYSAAQELGDPDDVLTGSDAFDTEEAIPRFAYGAEKAASEQGNLAMWDIKFSARYISGWRWEIVRSIRESAAAPKEFRQQEG
jgi:hypothetical protein